MRFLPFLLLFFLGILSPSIHASTVISGGISNDPLRAYTLNDNTGLLTAQTGNTGLSVGNSPDFLAFNSAATYLYVANENSARVASYKINSLSPFSLTFISEQNDQQNPAHIALHPSEKFVMTANYNQGSVVIYPINTATGALQARRPIINPGQNAHQIVYSVDGKYVFVPCLGSNIVAQYTFDSSTGNIAPNNPASVAVNGGPRHMVIHPTAPHAFVLTEKSNQLYHFDYNPNTGLLSNGRAISSLPPGVTTVQSGAEISFGLNYKFIYSSHRSNGGLNAIALFSLDASFNPTLVYTETGGGDIQFPRHFSIDPQEKILLVANQNGNTVTSFTIDQTTGRLTKVNTIQGPGQAAFVSVINAALSTTTAPITTTIAPANPATTNAPVVTTAAPVTTASTAPLCSTCVFVDGTDYYGGDVSQTTTNSQQGCCDACKSTNGCTRFTYRTSTGECFLKGDNVNTQAASGLVSGTICNPTSTSPASSGSTTIKASTNAAQSTQRQTTISGGTTLPVVDDETTDPPAAGDRSKSMTIRVKLLINFASVSTLSSFQPTLASEVCAVASIPSYRCKVVAMQGASGAVIVDIQISAPQVTSDTKTSAQAATSLKAIIEKQQTSDTLPSTMYLRTANSAQTFDSVPAGGESSSNNTMIIIIAASAVGGLLLIAGVIYLIVRWKLRIQSWKRNEVSTSNFQRTKSELFRV